MRTGAPGTAGGGPVHDGGGEEHGVVARDASEERGRSRLDDARRGDPRRPAIAFLFLTRGPLPHAQLWARFFDGQDETTYSIFVYAPIGFLYNATTTAAPHLFSGREVRALDPDPSPTVWGGSSLVRAERVLLRAALEATDRDNARFVLLSESCVPVFDFPFVREYLLRGEKSFVEAALDPQLRHPGPAMAADGVPRWAWRKGSQWFALTRDHARLVTDDDRIFGAFDRHCGVAVDRSARVENASLEAGASSERRGKKFCAPDEHYVPTLLTLLGRERELENRGVTYANWWPVTRRHPKRYAVQEAREAVETIRGKTRLDALLDGDDARSCGYFRGVSTEAFLDEDGDEMSYPAGRLGSSEESTDARASVQRRPCWLFARKFTPRAGARIARFASVVAGF